MEEKMKMKYMLLLLTAVVFSFSCYTSTNPLDEDGTSYVFPKIIYDDENCSLKELDTIHSDSIIISIMGNKDQSIFNFQMDSSEINDEWVYGGIYGFGNLIDGEHNLYITTMYEGGEIEVSDTFNFYILAKGYKPGFKKDTDTIIESFGKRSITLKTSADGISPIDYIWLKGDSILEDEDKNTLSFESFSIEDTSSYKCIASNEYGVDTSRTFILKYIPSTGIIKGVVTDTYGEELKKAVVTLLPSEKEYITSSNGKFSFTGLFKGAYTIKINLKEYVDTTIEDIEVNDSDEVDLEDIKLSWIDTTTYKVVYKGNDNDGGSVPTDPSKYEPGSEVKILDNKENLSKEGYTFLRWNVEKDGSGDSFEPGNVFNITDNITLYAEWKINSYTVTYEGNNNTSGSFPKDIEYDFNEKVSILDFDSLDRAGYLLKGWSTNRDDSVKLYSLQDTFNMPDANVVLFAQWEAMPTYRVVYNGNDEDSGSVPEDNDLYYEGKEITIKGNPGKLFKEGFFFSGWNTKPDGSGKDYNAGAKFSMLDTTVTFYVKWSSNPTYAINYHGNGSSGGEVPLTVDIEAGKLVSISDSGSLYKEGYRFVEWNLDEDGTGKSYKIGDKIEMDTLDINLYAQWEKAIYTITYYGNGNDEGDPPSVSKCYFDYDIEISDKNSLSKKGYNFIKWNTNYSGDGVDYYSGTFIRLTENIKLYAQWEIGTFNIIFVCEDKDYGDLPEDIKCKYEESIKIPECSLVKTGYTFKGWADNEGGMGTIYNNNEDYKMGYKDVFLYAQWNNPVGMVLINSKDKIFQMGGSDSSIYANEKPIHPVSFSKNMWFDTIEVTQKSFSEIMSEVYPSIYQDPEYWNISVKGDNYPAFGVNWYEAILYCNALTRITGSFDTCYSYSSIEGNFGTFSDKLILTNLNIDLSSKGFRLPTEAEWEFSAKANKTEIYFSEDKLDKIAWFVNNSSYTSHPVAQKENNGFNLYDMLGNVQEWTNDWFYNYTETSSVLVDPFNDIDGYSTGRVVRGGHHSETASKVSIPRRYWFTPSHSNDYIGFRCCLPIED
jgi:uncharacterized repeat protein (TIGR02543 family)